MLNISICDDNTMFLNDLENMINSFFKHAKEINFHLSRFDSLELLLESNITQTDVIFLDVHFKNANGIEAVSILRKISDTFILVFVSSFIEYAPAGYNVNAFRYILKDQINFLFDGIMNDIIQKLGYYRSQVTFKFIGMEKTIYTDSIIYIESHLHEVHFHFSGNVNNSLYLYDTLNSVQKKLPAQEFVRIHQSFLVNIRYLLDAKNYCALLSGKIQLPISQKLFPSVKKQLYQYRGRIS